MATDSSNTVIMGKITLAPFLIVFSLSLQVMRHSFACTKFMFDRKNPDSNHFWGLYIFLCLLPYNSNYLNRGSYMSAHVLFNLLKELGKRDKMQGLLSILSFFFALSLINSIIQEHEC